MIPTTIAKLYSDPFVYVKEPAYSLLNTRPMTMRLTSDVPAPISYSFALLTDVSTAYALRNEWTGFSMGMVVDRQTYSLSNLEAGISST